MEQIMTEEKSTTTPASLRRRSVVSGVAWSLPAVAVAVATPAAASSPQTPTALTLTAYDPTTTVPLQLRVGYLMPDFGGDVEVRLTDTATGAAVNNADITFQLIPGTGSAYFGSTSSGTVVVTDQTNSLGRADTTGIYGVGVGSASLVVTAPGANTLVYPVTIMHTAVLQLEDLDLSTTTVGAAETFYIDARVDLDLGASIDDETQRVHLTFKNMPASIYGEPTLGRAAGDNRDSLNWTMTRVGDDIVLSRPGYTRAGFDGANGNVYVSFTRPAGTPLQDVDVTVELSADNPLRKVDPASQQIRIRYV